MQDALIYLILGILVIIAAWIPLFLSNIPVSLPMIAVGLGVLIAFASGGASPYAVEVEMVRRLSEFALLVAVLGGGLKVDRPFSFRTWTSAWRLLGPVMLLSILAIAAAAIAGLLRHRVNLLRSLCRKRPRCGRHASRGVGGRDRRSRLGPALRHDCALGGPTARRVRRL
jgi:NhaP-type Na+/H+ or K+/H+ antiporter